MVPTLSLQNNIYTFSVDLLFASVYRRLVSVRQAERWQPLKSLTAPSSETTRHTQISSSLDV